jgi:phosphotriesterase-related protein
MELQEYLKLGGGMIVACQTPWCGRNANFLKEISKSSGVRIMASTGYHRRIYYPEDFWLFSQEENDAETFFVGELSDGMQESLDAEDPIRAGLINIACEDSVESSPVQLMRAAAYASLKTNCAMEVHTEKGSDTENILETMTASGMSIDKSVLCHMDKRPDPGLHIELSKAGVLLECDTFFRPKHDPKENVWLLLEKMVAAGLEDHVAATADMAFPKFWSSLGGSSGLCGFF